MLILHEGMAWHYFVLRYSVSAYSDVVMSWSVVVCRYAMVHCTIMLYRSRLTDMRASDTCHMILCKADARGASRSQAVPWRKLSKH